MTNEPSILTSAPKIDYFEEAPPCDLEAFRTVINSRRSVRVYESTPIPENVVRDCLEMALKAPNSSNLQTWEFYWAKTPLVKAKIVEACLSQPAAATAQAIIVVVARTKTWRRNAELMLKRFDEIESASYRVPRSARAYYSRLIPLAYSMGPFGLFGVLKKIYMNLVGVIKPFPREPSSLHDVKVWAVKSAALACENLMLAFRAHGYDSCPMEGLDSARVRKALNLPKDAVVVMAISAGKRARGGIYGPQIRFDSSLFIKEV